MEQIALYGGEKTKKTPYGTGKRFGEPELQQLREALEQNTLFYWHGKKTKELCQKFAALAGTEYGVANTSGTAAIHVALGALGVTVGDEVITSPITDMGSVIGILYQNALPVFADLDPRTYNLDPASVEKCITPRTKAIVVVHLAGNPADMDAILEIARRHNVAVIEDCAQSYGCYYQGKHIGGLGDIGCFSLNDFKHLSAGDGGMCVMNGRTLYEKAAAFADKNYSRVASTAVKNVEFLAPNYRMNELTAAVGLAQLDRMDWICAQRNAYGEKLTAAISDLPGILTPEIRKGNKSSYWFYMLRIDEAVAKVSRNEFAEALNAEGVPAQAGYIPTCVYEYPLFVNQNAYPGSHYPYDNPVYGKVEYKHGICPVAEQILETAVKLNVNEFYTEQDLQDTIAAIRKVSAYYRNR